MKSLLVGVLFSIVSFSTYAAHTEDQLEEFIDIATGRTQTVSRAPAIASVITAEEIKDMGATNIDEVLETIPGIHISSSSIFYSPIISIRGLHTDTNPQVLMLMNGVPLTQLLFGDRGFRSTLPIESIERIELIRGPGSAMYGADAFSGVINIITKSGLDIDGLEGGTRYGSFNTKEGWLLYGNRFDDLKVGFNFEYSATDGDKNRIINSDAQDLFDAAFGTDSSLTPISDFTQMKRLDFRLDLAYKNWQFRAWNWRQSSIGLGAGPALAMDPTLDSKINNYLLDLTYNKKEILPKLSFTSKISYMNIDKSMKFNLFPPNSILPIGSDGNINTVEPVALGLFPDGYIGNPGGVEEHYRLDISSFYTGFDNHIINVGAGILYARLVGTTEEKNFGPSVIDTDTLLPPPSINVIDGTLTDVSGTDFIFLRDEDRFVYNFSIQDEWQFAQDWTFTGGIRIDKYSDFGSTINPRVAFVWNTTDKLTSKLLFGSAFRAPSFTELYEINNPAFAGNPNLEPEKIKTFELAFDYKISYDIRTRTNLFIYNVDNLINFVADADSTSRTAQNGGNIKSHGIEMEVDWQITNDLLLQGNYSFQDTEDENTNSNFGSAPKTQIFLMSKWNFYPNWMLTPKVKWIGNRKRVSGDPRNDVDDYITVDLTLRRNNIVDRFSAALLIKNIFDEKRFEPSPFVEEAPNGSLIPNDFPLAGRYIGGEIRFNF